MDTLDIEAIMPLFKKLLPGALVASDESSLHAAMPLQDAFNVVRDYLAAATGKDCSIMFTMQQVLPSSEPTETLPT